MKAPGTAYDDPKLGKDPQPATMAGYVHTAEDNGGVHTNSGIPNHAFYLVAVGIGGNSWEKAGQIWYDTLTDHSLKPSANFAAFASLTVSHAGSRYGANSPEQKAVQDAWIKVGVLKKGKSAAA
jgi:Zn-dependent metalloprotease